MPQYMKGLLRIGFQDGLSRITDYRTSKCRVSLSGYIRLL